MCYEAECALMEAGAQVGLSIIFRAELADDYSVFDANAVDCAEDICASRAMIIFL